MTQLYCKECYWEAESNTAVPNWCPMCNKPLYIRKTSESIYERICYQQNIYLITYNKSPTCVYLGIFEYAELFAYMNRYIINKFNSGINMVNGLKIYKVMEDNHFNLGV